jgi:hypothetical protein
MQLDVRQLIFTGLGDERGTVQRKRHARRRCVAHTWLERRVSIRDSARLGFEREVIDDG